MTWEERMIQWLPTDRCLSLMPHQDSATESSTKPGELLIDLDRRQDDVLRELDELQQKVDAVLADFGITAQEDGETGFDSLDA